MKNETEKIRYADLLSVIPSHDKKSAELVSVFPKKEIIDADAIQIAENEFRAHVCADVVVA